MSHTDQKSMNSVHKSHSKSHSNQKATWLKINDNEEEEEEKRKEDKGKKTIKGIYKRNSNEMQRRNTADRHAKTQSYKAENGDDRIPPSRPKSVSTISGVGRAVEVETYKTQRYASFERDSNIDMEFDEKIKAFRSLIKTNPKNKIGTKNEPPFISKTGSNDVTSHGSHVKFNARSLEGRYSAPNEFQLTYEQDKYIMNKRNLDNLKDASYNIHREENSRKYVDSERTIDPKNMKDRFVHNGNNVDNDNIMSHLYSNDNKGSLVTSQNKTSTAKIIKRPPNYTDKGNLSERHITSILKQPQKDQIGRNMNSDIIRKLTKHPNDDADNELYSYGTEISKRHGTESPNMKHQEITSAKYRSHGTASSQLTRPPSVNDVHRETISSYRPHSAIPTSTAISGRLYSNTGSLSPSLPRENDKPSGSMSLQTHLNVLGASLSSLTSVVKGGDSSDSNMEYNDTRRNMESPSSLILSGKYYDYSNQLTDSYQRGSGSGGSRNVSVLNAAARNISASPSSELSCTSASSSLHGSVSFSAHKPIIATRPRSDDFFIRERLHNKVPNSPRVKQTNVQGIDDDSDGHSSILSARDDRNRPFSVSGRGHDPEIIRSSERSRISQPDHLKKDLSTKVLSKPNLRHYVRYVSRHGDTLAEYSSSNTGAKQTNNGSIYSHSMSSDVKDESKRVGKYRENQTQTPSDYSDNDTLVDEDSGDMLLSSKESHATVVENSKSSIRPQIVSKSKATQETLHESRLRIPSHSVKDKTQSRVNSVKNNGAYKTDSNNNNDNKSRTTEKKRIIKRPSRSPSEEYDRYARSDKRGEKEHRSIPPHPISGRSQTVLGLSSSKESIKKYDILPSRYSPTGSSQQRGRPHSACEKKRSDHKQKESKTLQLMKKVQHLHKEVDERLKSDKNKTHSLTSSLTNLFEMVVGDSDEEAEMISRSNPNQSTVNKARVLSRRKDSPIGKVKSRHKSDLESESERERYSSSSDYIITTSTPRKLPPNHYLSSPHKKYRDDSEDEQPQQTLIFSKLHRQALNNNFDYLDGEHIHSSKSQYQQPTNAHSDSPTTSPSVLTDKLRKILYSGHSPYKSRLQHDNDSSSDKLYQKERDRGEVDDDKDEDDTVTEESYHYRRNDNNALLSSQYHAQSNGWKENKGRTISPFIKRLAHVDILSQAGGHHGVDIHKTASGRASPADVLMGYLDNPNTVRLLQKLYQAEPIDREIIMIKVLYFKAWVHFSTSSKQKRLRKQALMKCADTFCYQRILALHFIVWERNARYSRNTRHASSLCRRHMLSKGFKALRWSVSHSRHCRELIQSKYRMLTTRASFDHWKNKTLKQRRERMENTWQRWKQFVTEVHKIRHMQAVMDRNIMEKVYTFWKKCYDKHMKQRMAFNYFRHTLYKHALFTWSSFVFTCKQKKEKYLSALSQYQTNLVKTTFYQIVLTFKKSRKARNHFRKQKLNDVFWSWKQASHICMNERKQDLLVSVEHCRKQTMVSSFRQWKQKMLLHKADAHANSHLYRKIFNRWLQSYHEKFKQRQEIEIALERNKLHGALLTWRRNVVQIQRRHKKAVHLIEVCFLRSTLSMWRHHVGAKTEMRQKVFSHQRYQERKNVSSWFCLWLHKYRDRMDDKTRQKLWSESCTRKLFQKWKHVCHQRSLERKLEETQPDRELRFLRTMFARWLTSLEKRRHEEEEAERMRENLEQRRLRMNLQIWRRATQQQLIIKPMMRQRDNRTLEECFRGWSQYTRSIVDCRKSKTQFLKIRIKSWFTAWRRHYIAHQVEKRIKTQFSHGILMCCFDEWKLFMQLKKKGHQFRHECVVRKTFKFWKDASSCQVTKRMVLKEEEVHNLQLKRQSFVAWWENVQEEKMATDVCVTRLGQARGHRVVSHAFEEWKRLLHSSLIARAYQKMFNQRLVLTMLLEWRGQIVIDVHNAVGVFQDKIGMTESREALNAHRHTSTFREGLQISQGLESEFGFNVEEDENMKMTYSGSLSSSFTAGLFHRLLDENSSIDSDTDRSFLLSGGLQDAALNHQTRCNRMKEIATTAIWRLQHWPMCVAFQQWQEFTGCQIQLKKAANQVRRVVNNLETALAFRQWKIAYTKMKTSRQHWDSQLKASTFAALHHFTKNSRHVKQLASRSQRHLKLKVFSQYFPLWLRKTQQQRREKHAVTLWTSSTAEEMELFPLESRLTTKLNDRTLRLCFSLWLLKLCHIQKIRHVYHTNTLQWVFSAWHEWASFRQGLVKKSETMICNRRTKMAFKKWCEKYRQSRQTEVLYQQAWQSYQTQILVQWHQWAKASHQRRSLYNSFKSDKSHRMLTSHLIVWKSLTFKVTVLQRRQRTSHLQKVFREWCRFVQDSKTKKQMTIQFQIRSYTLLVKRLFQHWHTAMVNQRTAKEERVQEAECKALQYGRLWKRKCQTLRGKQLKIIFQHRKVSLYLQTWQLRYASVQLLHQRLEVWKKRQNAILTKSYLQTWVNALKGNQMSRDYTSKLLHSIVWEWKIFTKESRDRRKRGLALTKALQERNLHVYFRFWVAITKVKMSVRFNAETKLQIKIMRSWHAYARNTSYLRQLQAHYTQRVNTRILSDAFTKMKWRAEYCNHLQEVADKIVHDRVRATLTAVLVLWKQRLDNILAARCYGEILVVRVVRQWRRFVHKRKTERVKEMADNLRAVNFDQKMVCKRAFAALRELVLVSKMAAKRKQRLCDKYALVWKTQVDLKVSAMEMEWGLLCWKMWRRWRREFVQRQSAKKVEKDNKRHAMSQAFKSWRKLCMPRNKETRFYQAMTPRPDRRISSTSQLPVPVGRSLTASTSSTMSPSSSSSSLSSSHR